MEFSHVTVETQASLGVAEEIGLDPDRYFPSSESARAIARELFEEVEASPIISPHGHVPVEWLADNVPFKDPTTLLVSPDHYVTRLLHASGVDLETLGVGEHAVDAREAWRIFCSHWDVLAGTASGGWLESEFVNVFGIRQTPSPSNADALFDVITRLLATPSFRPRALFDRFDIEVLATTDDPLDDLTHHRALADCRELRGRVLPTFRPDAYLDPDAPAFAKNIERLAAHAGRAIDDYPGYLRSLEERRGFFIEHGAVSADHGVLEPYTLDLDDIEAANLFRRAVRGQLSAEEARAFRGNMLMQMARMSVQDGLVMTVHAGVLRNHHTDTHLRHGADSGHDIPVRTEYTSNLRPLLEKHGVAKGFHLVLFTVDETTYSREIAPLAGFYPSVYIGAPWWFLDAPDAILRFRSSITETAGFSRGSGFVDDTRAFMSIPARHETARRLDASFLARYVSEGRLRLRQARRLIVDLVDEQPRKVFKL